MLHGKTIILYEKTKTGEDPLGNDVFQETPVLVENVLIAPAQEYSGDITTSTDFKGKKEIYVLGIPKGDSHDWLDKNVEFWGRKWRTIGYPKEGIEELIPLSWNKKVMVEHCE